jgi:hypothetical protein
MLHSPFLAGKIGELLRFLGREKVGVEVGVRKRGSQAELVMNEVYLHVVNEEVVHGSESSRSPSPLFHSMSLIHLHLLVRRER